MNQYTFTRREKNVLIGFMVLGVLCMLLTYVGGDEYHTRFWTNYLHNSVFFTGIAFLALFFMCAKTMAFSGWHIVFKRIWEASSQFLLVGIILMGIVVIGVWTNIHHLYHWANADSVSSDELLQHKSSFLNPTMFTLFTLGFLGIYYFFARKMRALSLEEDKQDRFDYKVHRKKTRFWASVFLPLAGFSSAAVIWQWVMSIDAHWYSTLFAWYSTISWLVAMLCITVLLIVYLKSRGYLTTVTADHLHDLGKYIFGFSIFWTYLWFSQYMLIWYGNIGEETVYFRTRFDEYPVLFYGNLFINFVIPFFVLLRNDTKRKIGSMTFISIVLLLGHWIDYFLMVKPGVYHTAHELAAGHGHEEVIGEAANAADTHGAAALVVEHMEEAEHSVGLIMGQNLPGLLEIGTFLGFGALFVYIFFAQLEKTSLFPKGDPFIDESLHHHVI